MIPVVLVVSGGISLGAYQAGVNWGLVELIRRSENRAFRDSISVPRDTGRWHLPPLTLAATTGASAGTINSVLTAVEWCREPAYNRPEDSLFWKVWVRTGWEQLFPSTITSPRVISPTDSAIYHRQYFQKQLFPLIESLLATGTVRASCRDGVPIGITITKLAPDDLPVDRRGMIKAATQRFASLMWLKPDSRSDTLRFLRYESRRWNARAFGKLAYLPTSGGTSRIARADVFNLVQASSAFPYAFAPVEVEYIDAADRHADPRCDALYLGCQIRRAAFMDGGVFDNNPLDLAYGLHVDAHRQRAGPAGPATDTILPDPQSRVLYIDPDVLRGKLRTERARRPDSLEFTPRGIGLLSQLFAVAFPAATQYELQSFARGLARDTSGGRDQWIRTTSRSYPIVGEHLGHFAAFLGRPFREYDFYVGIYDGFDYVARDIICSDAPDVNQCAGEAMGHLIRAEMPHLGPIAPHVLQELYRAEHRDSLPGVLIAYPDSAIEKSALDLSLALVRANAEQFSGLSSDCRKRSFAQRVICNGGFDRLALKFAQEPQVDSLIRVAAADTACGRSKWEKAPAVRACLADETFVELIHDPYVFADTIADRILFQAWRVENTPGAKDTFASYESLVEALSAVHRLVSKRRPKVQWDPSSLPSTGFHEVIAWKIVPYHFSFDVGAGGVEIGYRPTWNRWSRFALVAPFTPAHVTGGIGPQKVDGFTALGGGLLWRTDTFLLRVY
ncbi:MAG: patatin-like phospholipase family protein, partial [Gemmatimonadetes bacterium]|nr:patatin-like phospholipase family protein [Gemmatimonadota bacterium]